MQDWKELKECVDKFSTRSEIHKAYKLKMEAVILGWVNFFSMKIIEMKDNDVNEAKIKELIHEFVEETFRPVD